MDWSNIERMDPNLLVGVVNTAIRNHFESLEDFCRSHGIDQTALCQRLAEGDYEYLDAAKQFR